MSNPSNNHPSQAGPHLLGREIPQMADFLGLIHRGLARIQAPRLISRNSGRIKALETDIGMAAIRQIAGLHSSHCSRA